MHRPTLRLLRDTFTKSDVHEHAYVHASIHTLIPMTATVVLSHPHYIDHHCSPVVSRRWGNPLVDGDRLSHERHTLIHPL